MPTARTACGWGLSNSCQRGLQVNLFTSFRRREHDAFSQLLDARRHDDIKNYFLTLKFPQLAFHDVVQTIAIEHTRVGSNVDWLYSEKRRQRQACGDYRSAGLSTRLIAPLNRSSAFACATVSCS